MKQQWSSTVYILAYIWKSICNITHEENMTLIITVYDLKNLRVVLLIKREKQLIFYGWINCDNKTYVSKCTTYEFSLMFSVVFQYLSNNIVFPLIGFELSSTFLNLNIYIPKDVCEFLCIATSFMSNLYRLSESDEPKACSESLKSKALTISNYKNSSSYLELSSVTHEGLPQTIPEALSSRLVGPIGLVELLYLYVQQTPQALLDQKQINLHLGRWWH